MNRLFVLLENYMVTEFDDDFDFLARINLDFCYLGNVKIYCVVKLFLIVYFGGTSMR